MEILLEIHLTTFTPVGPNRGMRRGLFKVNDRDYNKDPLFTASVEAYKFIEQIHRDAKYMGLNIDKVLWEDEDITEEVKKIRPIIPEDNLPF
ncbi:hypothetical protein [Robertmurraya kyonggiensis]|uniref:Uncharacterized protein n=1 Tax=Robertmurraya kyonggiensis TaxID=1037680 RepID=A0A4U1D040_9BACI|nr:hypothetical protein [Robertmurraya kyonggiensis]TKC15665.1 hypothetical protein FA727_16190 [Robertmurraya kyonggiensis]